MAKSFDQSPTSPQVTKERFVPTTDRGLAILNAGVAGLCLLVVAGMVVLLVLMLSPGGRGGGAGGGWGEIGVAMALGILISAVCISLVTIVPLSLCLLLTAHRLWHGDPSGRKLALAIAWIVVGGTILFGLYAWLSLSHPMVYAIFGILPAIYVTLHFLLLNPSRASMAACGVLVGTIVLSFGAELVGNSAVANSGRVLCNVEPHFGATILTSTDEIMCIGTDSSSTTSENVLAAWSLKSGKQIRRQTFPRMGSNAKNQFDVCLSKGLIALTVESDEGKFGPFFGDVLIARLPSGEQYARLPKIIKGGSCNALKLSPNGEQLAVSWGPGKADIYSVPDGALLRSMQVTTNWQGLNTMVLAFDPHGESLIVASAGSLALWSVPGNEDSPRWTISVPQLLEMCVDARGQRLFVLSPDDLFAVDLATGNVATRYPHPNLDHLICAGGFSSDGSECGVVLQDGQVKVWDTNSGQSHGFSIGRQVGVDMAALNLDTMRLVAASPTPGSFWLSRWDVTRGAELREFETEATDR